MDEWVRKSLAKWPNVPALYGWLRLDRRGRWFIKGELVERPALVELIGRNYAADAHGRWFFQNGPQRGYVDLEYAPLVLRTSGDGLATHTGLPVARLDTAWLDEEGGLLLSTEHGPALLADRDLDWALQRLQCNGRPVNEEDLAAALEAESEQPTRLTLRWNGGSLPLSRLDRAAAPKVLGFCRKPEPLGDELSCEQADKLASP